MQNRYLYFIRIPLIISDWLLLTLSFFAALYFSGNYPPGNNWKYAYLVVMLNWVMSTNVFKLYRLNPINNFKGFAYTTFQTTAMQLVLLLVYINFIGSSHTANFSLVFVVAQVVMLAMSRFLFIKLEPLVKKWFGPKQPIALFEFKSSDGLLTPYLNQFTTHQHFEAFTHQEYSEHDPDDREAARYDQFFKDARANGLAEVYVSLSPDHFEGAAMLQKDADKHGIRLKLIYNNTKFFQVPALTSIGNIPVVSFRKEPLEDIANVLLKRVFDIIFSLLVIVLVLSWLFPIIALLIVCENWGPVFFKQMRNGINGKQFRCFKFRSMRVNDLGDIKQASRQDTRITKIGAFIRKTSIDELPQFWNVLMGTMSVVGPRPHMLKHTEEYRDLIDNYMVRHYLKPGITGWAQVNGYRGETGTLDLMEKRVEHDIWYIENWSISLDLQIIMKTISNIAAGEKSAH